MEATAYSGNLVVRCHMQNLSVGGAAIKTRVEAEAGRFLRLHFPAGAGAALDADGVVVRCTTVAGTYVWGVMFVGLDAATLARIKTALASPPKAAPASSPVASPKPPSSRPPVPSSRAATSAGPGSRRELKELFKEALDEVKKR